MSSWSDRLSTSGTAPKLASAGGRSLSSRSRSLSSKSPSLWSGKRSRPPAARTRLSVYVLLLVWAAPHPSDAQQGPQLTANDFNIDMVIGPVLGSGRTVGLAGAYTALATGIDGAPWNPASYASRTLWDLNWFSWEVTFNFMTPVFFAENDFDNNGQTGFKYRDFIFYTPGLRLQFGEFGLGGILHVQQYAIPPPERDRAPARLQMIVGNYGLGYMLFNGQVVLGLGARTADLVVSAPPASGGLFTPSEELASMTGTGPELGALIKPAGRRFRMGIAARLPVASVIEEGTQASGPRREAGFVLPNEVRLPWQLQLGFAYQLGKRPMNRAWDNPHDLDDQLRIEMLARRWKRYTEQARRERSRRRGGVNRRQSHADDRLESDVPPRAFFDQESEAPQPGSDPYPWIEHKPRDARWWAQEKTRRIEEEAELALAIRRAKKRRKRQVKSLPRDYVLISAEMIVTGATKDGVGLEGFLAQRRERSGRTASFGFRVGAETEPIAHHLKIRTGLYLEPSRFRGIGYRPHVTAGFDLRLFEWDLFGWLWKFDVRLGGTADFAPRYRNFGLGVGFWH